MDILIYGATDAGKTRLASTLPNTIIVDFDNLSHKAGVMEDEVYVIPKTKDGKLLTAIQRYAHYEAFIQALTYAKSDKDVPKEFEYIKDDLIACENIVLDTMGSLEELIMAYTRETNPKLFKEMTTYMDKGSFDVSVGVGQHIGTILNQIKDAGVSVIATSHAKKDDQTKEVVPAIHFTFRQYVERAFHMIGYLQLTEEGRVITFRQEGVLAKGIGTYTNPDGLQVIVDQYKKDIAKNNTVVNSAKEIKVNSKKVKTLKDLNNLVESAMKLPDATRIACRKYILEAVKRLDVKVELDKETSKYVQV